MTADNLYRDLLRGYFRRLYGKTLAESKVVVDSMYSWHVRPEKVLAWRSSTPRGRVRELSLQQLHKDPMHWELGGWEAPVRYCQLTGDPWLATVLLKIGQTAVPPTEGNRPIRNESILRDGYGNPMQLRADLYRWTARPQYLEALAGAASVRELAGKYARSPFRPAEPEAPLSRRDLYERSLHPSLGNRFPAGYLWPSGAYYRFYSLYPLQRTLKSGMVE
jgi:hypothetical protein